MSLKLCPSCGTLLTEIATDNLVYVCDSCKKQYEPNNEDTLLYEENKGITVTSHQQLIKSAADDRLNPRRRMICVGKCKKEVWTNYIIVGSSMTVIYTCLDCKHQWIP